MKLWCKASLWWLCLWRGVPGESCWMLNLKAQEEIYPLERTIHKRYKKNQPVTYGPVALLQSCARVWKFLPRIPLLCSSSAGEKKISCFSPSEEEQSRGIFGRNFQMRAHNCNKTAVSMGLQKITIFGQKELGLGRMMFVYCNISGSKFTIFFVIRIIHSLNLILSQKMANFSRISKSWLYLLH